MKLDCQKSISDKDVATLAIGCTEYKPTNIPITLSHLNNINRPIFNKFQLEKSKNNIFFYAHHMKKLLSQVTYPYKKLYKFDIIGYIDQYYQLFKSNFYNRYKVLSFTTPYDTNIIPLKYNIKGDIDLIIKTSYGITFINYVYNDTGLNYYYHVNHTATRLQIAAKCFELMYNIKPDLLCLVAFGKKMAFKRYIQVNDNDYFKLLDMYFSNQLPIKKTYGATCSNCRENTCAPWKTKEELFI